MSSDIGGSVADRQRSRASRGSRSKGAQSVDPPRQRRPALAALALLLIVGGALGAGVLALRMDTRDPMLAAARTIEPGTEITAEDLKEVPVASEGLQLISAEHAETIIGTYAVARIDTDMLIDQRMLDEESPVTDDRAVVAVQLDPRQTPADQIRAGDLVQLVHTAGSGGSENASSISQGLVTSVTAPDSSSELGASAMSSANVLVPSGAALDVLAAASEDAVGIALLARGQSTDVELEVSQ